jgi:hypothetical protein
VYIWGPDVICVLAVELAGCRTGVVTKGVPLLFVTPAPNNFEPSHHLMVHRPSDSRLLNSLLSNEKEYQKQLLALVDNYSQHSLTAFAAYASASPAPVARAVIAVAGSFAGADDALRRYAATVETWQAELRALKELEEEVGNVMRDREILLVHPFLMPHVVSCRQYIPV